MLKSLFSALKSKTTTPARPPMPLGCSVAYVRPEPVEPVASPELACEPAFPIEPEIVAKPVSPKIELKDTDHPSAPCFIGVPSLALGAVVQLKFQMQIFFRNEFAHPEYLLRCRAMYFRFLDLKAKLDKQGVSRCCVCRLLMCLCAVQGRARANAWHRRVVRSNLSVSVVCSLSQFCCRWQAHLIRPLMYRAFCIAKYGFVIDRDLVASDPAKSAAETAKVCVVLSSFRLCLIVC